MERRKFVIGLGSLAAGGAAALGTGAVNSVEAERSVEIDIQGDGDAYLALTGDEEFIDDHDPGGSELELAFGVGEDTDEGGEGFNENAETVVEEIVTIENQGTEDNVTVEFGEDGGEDLETTVELDEADVTLELPTNNDLDPGNSTHIDATVDTRDPSGSEESGEVTIYAEVE